MPAVLSAAARGTALPRRVRWILALLFMASFLNYLDRQTLLVLKPAIKGAFALDEPGDAWLGTFSPRVTPLPTSAQAS